MNEEGWERRENYSIIWFFFISIDIIEVKHKLCPTQEIHYLVWKIGMRHPKKNYHDLFLKKWLFYL